MMNKSKTGLHYEHFDEMLRMQDTINKTVNPGWLTANYAFFRAVAIESAEGMDHASWKWWKHQERDLPQLQMELVDIFHFMLSAVLVAHEGDYDLSAKLFMPHSQLDEKVVMFDGRIYVIEEMDLLGKLELLMGLSVARRISVSLFSAILADCEMTWDMLYRQYVAKNTLNMFRQDHGYKTGAYQKLWAGREDNVHLVEVMGELADREFLLAGEIYLRLRDRYVKLNDIEAI
jgi:hypothetical protein